VPVYSAAFSPPSIVVNEFDPSLDLTKPLHLIHLLRNRVEDGRKTVFDLPPELMKPLRLCPRLLPGRNLEVWSFNLNRLRVGGKEFALLELGVEARGDVGPPVVARFGDNVKRRRDGRRLFEVRKKGEVARDEVFDL
jgi:hypothetical protein